MSTSLMRESIYTLQEVNNDLSTLENAIALAVEEHAGQVDKAGAPYILHPLRVMLAMKSEYERIAAVLHDVVEDCGVTLDELRERGFPEPVVEAVEALTKRRDEHGPDKYFTFIERAGQDDIARAVKLADIAENMDLSRIESPTEEDFARVERYGKAKKLLELIGREHGGSVLSAPTILPLRNRIAVDVIESACPASRSVVVCDFYVEGAKHWSEEPGGLRLGRILNVDHHAPIERMERPVTSTELAHEYLASRSGHAAESAPWVAINHTDCDSVLSSALIMGLIQPDEELVAASIAADHTGEPNAIADLLQGLDEGREGDRTDEQYTESMRNLLNLRAGMPLELCARRALDLRLARRDIAKRLVVESGRFMRDGPLAWVILDEEVDGSLFRELLPDAAVIMLALPHPRIAGRWIVKLRLGIAAPSGVTLQSLKIEQWDPNYGGRWNAGSNKRGKGTPIAPAEYAAHVRAALDVAES